MTGKDVKVAASVLGKVIGEGTYLHIALKDVSEKGAHLLVYGVMEKYFTLNYIADALCDKLKNNLRPFMLIALYCVLYAKLPFAVAVKVVTDGLESAGKGAVKGFFTAVMAKADRAEYSLPAPGKKGYDEVRYNLPSWLIGLYKKEYGEKYGEVIDDSQKHRTHVVVYCKEEEVLSADPNAEKTSEGYYVKNGKEINDLCACGKATYMSLGSALICKEGGSVAGKKVLDCCAAPGGKSVYFAKRGAFVTACDVYDHRVKLIDSYAKRMGVNVEAVLCDGTKRKDGYVDGFDLVLCDVPCSGLGVIDKKRDIVLNRTYEDILSLASLQAEILENCSAYVKRGGTLLYSTCTVFSKENGDVVDGFLTKHDDFVEETRVQYLPDGKGMEGFFVCRMRRN